MITLLYELTCQRTKPHPNIMRDPKEVFILKDALYQYISINDYKKKI